MDELPWVACPIYQIDHSLDPRDRFANTPPEILDMGRDLLAAVMQEIPANAQYLADAVRVRTANRFHAEITALADSIGASWRDLTLANISYDLTLAMFGCSTVALATPNGPVVARNMDWWPEEILAKSSVLIGCHERGKLRYANAGWPGAVGVVTGLSGRGFALVLNAVVAPDEGPNPTGYPVLFHLRRVLDDAADFDQALKMLADTKLAASGLITLVGTKNEQRVVVERSPTRHALRWADGNAALVTTNDFRSLYPPETRPSSEIYRTTCHRYEYLQSFFADHDPDSTVTDAKLLYALTDQNVIQTITAQHILMRPYSNEVQMFVPRALLA